MAQLYPAALGPKPPFTVANNIFTCGVDSPTVFKTSSQVQRNKMIYLMMIFHPVWIKQSKNLKKSSNPTMLTVTKGQICLASGIQRNLRAFIQWTRDLNRHGEDPTQVLFDVNNTVTSTKCMKYHDLYVQKSKMLIEMA